MAIDMKKDKIISEIYKKSKKIAVIGLSPKEEKPSHWVSAFLQEKGYKIIPVYPKGDVILDEPVHHSISDIDQVFDLALIFRKSEVVVDIVKELLDLKYPPKYIWMQDNVYNEEAKKIAEENGIKVIMDNCIYREYPKYN